MTKSRKKIRDLILSEKCKKIKIKLKKEKDNKNILLNNKVRTELKTESNIIKKIKFQNINSNNNNKKDRIIVTKKKFLNKNKNLSENLSKSSISNKNMPKIEQKVTNWKFLNNKNNRNLFDNIYDVKVQADKMQKEASFKYKFLNIDDNARKYPGMRNEITNLFVGSIQAKIEILKSLKSRTIDNQEKN